MKRTVALILTISALILTLAACGPQKTEPEPPTAEPELSQMRAICELAVMGCYYHNVAKFSEEDAEGFLWWKKDKLFWIEYSGVVKLGIDVSLVDLSVDGDQLTITLPDAKVLECKVDPDTLTKDSFIISADSAAIEASDEVAAFDDAQRQLEEAVSNDRTLLTDAQQRAKKLLEDYVGNIAHAVNKSYTIKWVYVSQDVTAPAEENAAA